MNALLLVLLGIVPHGELQPVEVDCIEVNQYVDHHGIPQTWVIMWKQITPGEWRIMDHYDADTLDRRDWDGNRYVIRWHCCNRQFAVASECLLESQTRWSRVSEELVRHPEWTIPRTIPLDGP